MQPLRPRALFVALSVLAAACAEGLGPSRSAPVWSTGADLDGDGAAEAVWLYANPGRTRGFLYVAGRGEQWVSGLYPLWKAAAGDLDGDGRSELVIGAWSRTRRHVEPEPHRTAWVLGWDGRALRELWRGSALGRPVRDLDVLDLDGDGRAELLARESGAGRCHLTAYRWTGFGFTGLASRALGCEDLAPCPDDAPPGTVCGRSGRARPRLERGVLTLVPAG